MEEKEIAMQKKINGMYGTRLNDEFFRMFIIQVYDPPGSRELVTVLKRLLLNELKLLSVVEF